MPWTPPDHPTPVISKWYVSAVSLRSWGTEVELNVVGRGDDNKTWAAATPSGSLKMTVKNDVAAEQFWPGQEWLVRFDPVPQDEIGKEGMGT